MADQAEYKIRVRDKNLKLIGEVANWMSLDVHLLFNEVGKWSMDLDADSDAAKLFLEIARDPDNGGKGGVYIERIKDGHKTLLLSGPKTKIHRTRSSNGKLLRVSGLCDLRWLQKHLAAPHPQYFRSPYMTLTGTATGGHADYIPDYDKPGNQYSSWHIHTAVRTNIGEGAPAQRPPLSFLTTRDNSVGYIIPAGEYTIARGENLFRLCQDVADYSDYMGKPIRMTAYQYDTGKDADGTPIFKVRFECIASQNRPNVILSDELGTITDYEYSVEEPDANVILMGGSGEGKGRRFAFDEDAASVRMYGRIEAFEEYTGHQNDANNSQWSQERAKLIQQIRSILAERAEKTVFTFDFQETPTIQYGRDFQIGDTVTIRVDGRTTTDVVRAVSFSVRGGEEKIELIVGKQSYIHKGLRLFDNVKQLKYRYSDLTKRNQGQ